MLIFIINLHKQSHQIFKPSSINIIKKHLILGGMNNSELKTMNLVDQPKNNMVLSAQKDDILYEP